MVNQKLTLLRNGAPLPAEIVATEAQLTGSVRYLFDYVSRMLKLTPRQLDLIRPGFETLDLAIGDKIEDWNQVFLHVLEELQQKGVELEQREALLCRMRRDGRTLLYRRELGEERLLTTLREEHRGNGFGIEMVDHDRFKHYNDTYGHEIGDLVLEHDRPPLPHAPRRRHRRALGRRRISADRPEPGHRDAAGPHRGPRCGAGRFVCVGVARRRASPSSRRASASASSTASSRREKSATRMVQCDDLVNLQPEQRFDKSVEVPEGSSYDIARKLVALADRKCTRRSARSRTAPNPTSRRSTCGSWVESWWRSEPVMADADG